MKDTISLYTSIVLFTIVTIMFLSGLFDLLEVLFYE